MAEERAIRRPIDIDPDPDQIGDPELSTGEIGGDHECDDPICQAFGRGFSQGWKAAEHQRSDENRFALWRGEHDQRNRAISAESELRELREGVQQIRDLMDWSRPNHWKVAKAREYSSRLLTNQETESR